MFLGIACNATVDWQGPVKTSEFLIAVKQACANFVELGAKKITVNSESWELQAPADRGGCK